MKCFLFFFLCTFSYSIPSFLSTLHWSLCQSHKDHKKRGKILPIKQKLEWGSILCSFMALSLLKALTQTLQSNSSSPFYLGWNRGGGRLLNISVSQICGSPEVSCFESTRIIWNKLSWECHTRGYKLQVMLIIGWRSNITLYVNSELLCIISLKYNPSLSLSL